MVLTADRTLYLTTKAMKKIQKIIVPEDQNTDMVTLVFDLTCLLPYFIFSKKVICLPWFVCFSAEELFNSWRVFIIT